MTYHVTVTAEDIRDGEPGSAKRCAVARALARVVPNFSYCMYSYLVLANHTIVRLPREVSDAIELLDRSDRSVQPFEFDVVAPA